MGPILLFTGIGFLLGWILKSDNACRVEKIQVEQRAEREFRRAMVDPLTKAFNRRYMESVLKEWWDRSSQGPDSFSLLMIDLNQFKFINDHYGHHLGDRVLQETAQTLLSQTRPTDFLFRYGGDEFLILLPRTGFDRAIVLAKRLREEMEKLTFQGPDQTSFKADFSAGIIEYSPKMKSLGALLDQLDQSLYQAKREPTHLSFTGSPKRESQDKMLGFL